MKSTDYSMFVVWSNQDEAFLAIVPDLPGCVADGETREQAVTNAQDVIVEWIDAATEMGRTIPQPRDHAAICAIAQKQLQDNAQRFANEVQTAVQNALTQLVPHLTAQIEQALKLQMEHQSQVYLYGSGTNRIAEMLNEPAWAATH